MTMMFAERSSSQASPSRASMLALRFECPDGPLDRRRRVDSM